jgi:hypothetical protein
VIESPSADDECAGEAGLDRYAPIDGQLGLVDVLLTQPVCRG